MWCRIGLKDLHTLSPWIEDGDAESGIAAVVEVAWELGGNAGGGAERGWEGEIVEGHVRGWYAAGFALAGG